jgi:hypothetical protein
VVAVVVAPGALVDGRRKAQRRRTPDAQHAYTPAAFVGLAEAIKKKR